MYGVGQGLMKGVETAGNFLVPALRDKMALDRREKLYDKQLKADASILAGQNPSAMPVSNPGVPGPGAMLAGGPAMGGANPLPAGPIPAPVRPEAAGAEALAGPGPTQAPQSEFLSEDDVYNMYKEASTNRTNAQIKMADEMDVARGWNKSKLHLETMTRSMMGIQNALKDPSGNAAMILVPQAQDPDQARQILSGEYMKLLQQYKPLEQEYRLWDGKRNELGIDPKEIATEPGIAQYLNRLQQKSKAGVRSAPGARSVMPSPSRNR